MPWRFNASAFTSSTAIFIYPARLLPPGLSFVQSVNSLYPAPTECRCDDVIDIWFSALYAQLCRLAKIHLTRLAIPTELNETILLHDAYLQMASRTAPLFVNELHFMKYLSRVMHGLIVDHVRNRNALKRGRDFEITRLTQDIGCPLAPARELTTVRNTLDQLAKAQPEFAELVDLKFFHGFSFSEIALMQKVSERTIQRKWEKARLYMRSIIQEDLNI